MDHTVYIQYSSSITPFSSIIQLLKIPHPGMADTYGCTLKNSVKHKHRHDTTLQPYQQLMAIDAGSMLKDQ